MNLVILSGRLTKDPEIRYTNSKKAVASFTVAVEDGKDKDGNRRAQFLPCIAWEKTAELIDQYFTKGKPITVTGKLTVRSYDKDGEKRYVSEVVVSGIEFPLTEKAGKTKEEKPTFEDMPEDDEGLPF